ncbi:MAG: TonB-dependent receptor [Bacteroides sp.]|nr:TonB-dependent receptor [Bacteroides sp.]
MMKRCLLQLLLIHTLVCVAYAQSGDKLCVVQGQVVDSVTLEPISYATIVIQRKGGDYSNGTTTDLNGNFSLQLLGHTEYLLSISCIGYDSFHQSVSLSDSNIHIGKIRLGEKGVQLSEVAVVGRKERIKLSTSGLTYNMKNDPLSQSENLLFALRNVPLVTVDGDGGIRVKGSSSFSIYLNGKPYRMATTNPKEVLQSISATSVSKIELITQLDARYDASVGNAIINIITEKKSLDGYKVVLNGSGETHPKTGAGVTAIITKGKIDASLSYDCRYTRESDQKVELNRDNIQNGEIVSKLQTNGIANGNFQYHTGRGMLVYNIDSLNSLYADAHVLLKVINSELENKQLFETTEKQYSKTREIANMNSGACEFNFVYQNLYKKNKSERLTLGYRYAYTPDKRNTKVIGYEYPDIFTDWDSGSKELTRQKDETNGGLHEHTVQLDYRLPLGKYHVLRFGGKDVLRKAEAIPGYWLWDDTTGAWVNNADSTDAGRMNQLQNIVSTYLTYNYRKGKFNLNAGGRLECSHNKIDFKDNPQADFTSNLVNFIPRFNLSWNLSTSSQLSLAFSSGVVRPSIWSLNPFREQLNEFQLKYGNPDLKSEKQYNTSLSYMSYSDKWFVSLDLDYNRTKDAIVEYPFRDENNPKLLISTYGNIGSYRRLGGSFYVNYKPINELSFSANGTMTHNNVESEALDLKQKKLSYNASASCDASLSHGWLLGGRWSVFKQTPKIRISYNSFQMYSFYAYKHFMNGNLSVGLVANQPFSKCYNSRVISTGDDFIQNRTNYIKARSFGINLSYSFGAGKVKKVKRNKRIQNDDLQQSTGVK